jgi:hypothetical protein
MTETDAPIAAVALRKIVTVNVTPDGTQTLRYTMTMTVSIQVLTAL